LEGNVETFQRLLQENTLETLSNQNIILLNNIFKSVTNNPLKQNRFYRKLNDEILNIFLAHVLNESED
jgi:hypothetical protein